MHRPLSHKTAALACSLAMLLVASHAAAGAAPNRILGIDVDKSGQARTVRIKTSGEPTFTVFRLKDPMRVVVDISGGDLGDLKGPLSFEDGVLGQVALRQYQADGFSIGRVIIGFELSCGYDVQTEGNDVVVRANGMKDTLIGHAGQGSDADLEKLAAARSAAEAAQTQAQADRLAAEAAQKQASAQKEEAGKLRAQADAVAAHARELEAQAAKERDEAAQAARTEASKPVDGVPTALAAPAVSPMSPESAQEAPAPAVVANVRPQSLLGVAHKKDGVLLKMSGQPTFESAMLDNPPRLVVDLPGSTRHTQRLNYAIENASVKRVRLGDQSNGVRAVFDLQPGAEAPQVRVTEAGLWIGTGDHKAAVAQVKAEQAEIDVGKVLDVRFRHTEHGGVPIARISLKVRGDVQARVDQTSTKSWTLQLDNATVTRGLERSLDTSAANTAVGTLSTFQASETPPIVNVVASLNSAATSTLKREHGGWVWEIVGGSAPLFASAAYPQTAGFTAEAASIAQNSVGQSDAGRKRISLDVKDADIVNVLRLISEETGENIIASDDVKGKVTLKLRNVPADLALDTMLKTKGFDKVRQNNILRIAPAEAIQKERDLELAKKRSQTEVEETLIKMVTVNYATAGEILDQIKPMMTSRGSVQTDARTNTLIIQDIGSNIDRLVELARRLDKQTPLVNIQTRIVEATTNHVRDLGVQFGGTSKFTEATGNATGLAFPASIITGGAADAGSSNQSAGLPTPTRYAVNLPAVLNGAGGGLGFTFGSADGSQFLNLRLTAMEQNGTGRIISSPEISTLDNKTAKVSQGVEIPVSVVSAAGVNTRFISAALELEVTPHVTNDGTVLLKIKATKSQPDFTNKGANGDPTIQKKYAETEVLVRDGDTSVIGGIYQRTMSEAFNEVPFLARIPLLGTLFREHSQSDQRSELLVFITPRIINRDESMVQSTSLTTGPQQ